jgi:hypothetical protein
MKVLEARFHPGKRTGDIFVVVGRVCCNGRGAVITPGQPPSRSTANIRLDFTAMVEKLRYLVRASGTKPFEKLRQLHSEYWSFIEV